MTRSAAALFAAALFLAVSPLRSQLTESKIAGRIDKLRSLPDNKRPAETIQLAQAVQALPAGTPKLRLADALSHLVTEGDQGADALQAVADALAKSLAETPVPANGDQPPMQYFDLARLVRYEHINVTLNDPLYAKATEILAANDADIEKADFTLKDLHDKPWTLSELRGKIVMVNFWATWCPPCRKEMPDLDALYKHFQKRGLVILAISDEDAARVKTFIAGKGISYNVLLDPGRKVNTLFNVMGIPKTFIYDRSGKLVAESIDMRTRKQFLEMLAQAGLQ
jgi:peroxiredoxin